MFPEPFYKRIRKRLKLLRLQQNRNFLSDLNFIFLYFTIIRNNMYALLPRLLQRLPKLWVCPCIWCKVFDILHLDHKENICFISILNRLAQFFHMFYSTLCWRIRKFYHSIFLECHTFYFYKNFAFLFFCI